VSDIANMIRFHRDGLRRFSSVIEGNPDYDDLMGHKLIPSDAVFFDDDVNISEKRRQAIALFESRIRRRSYKIVLPEFSGLACDGLTRNNTREFAFFERICADLELAISKNNYANCERIAISKLKEEHEDALEAILSDVQAFYSDHPNITASLVHQQILYSSSFFSFLIAFSMEGAAKPVALVQANDHAPVRVALSMIMKGLGIPRVYLQHAEVTRHFPELDFEYSVLRNKQSLGTYESIGRISGKVYVIPRYEDEFARDKLAKERGPGTAVVIYPTSRVVVDELRRVISALENNPAVGRVLVKQHPGSAVKLNHLLDGSSCTVVEDIPLEDYIAIVGNSSAAIELLHRGIPVYQNFDFDPVQGDYYGFVKSGLTFEVSQQDLAGKFWLPYNLDEAWLQTYASWDPSANPDHRTEQAEFVKEMAALAELARARPEVRTRRMTKRWLKLRTKRRIKRLVRSGLIRLVNASPRSASWTVSFILAGTERTANFLFLLTQRAASFLHTNTKAEIKTPAWSGNRKGSGARSSNKGDEASLLALLEHTLCTVEKPADWLKLNDQVQAFTPFAVITALETMFQNRSPALNRVFDGFPVWPAGSVAGTWIYLKKLEWGNIEVGHDELEDIATFIYGHRNEIRVRDRLERLLFWAIVRCGTCAQLDRFWLNASVVRKEELPIDRQIGVVRKLRSTPGREAEAERTLADFEKCGSQLERLKLRNMNFLEGRPVEGWDHAYAERQFTQVASRGIAREFAQHVQPAYDALRPRMRFMDTRINAAESEAFLELVKAALRNATPFSLIRLSDGEGYLFPEGSYFSLADAKNRERHWWGRELPDDLRSRIVGEARRALSEADIVGIPPIYRFIRDHKHNSTSLTKSVQGRGLLEVLNGGAGAISSTALIAEDKVNVSIFKDIETVALLGTLARKTIVVSSVTSENLPPELNNLQRLEAVVIPTHHKTALNRKYHGGSAPLPFVYEPLVEKLGELAAPGDLVLVAGGIVGKIFIGRARANGAVALDIGHVLDDWVHAGMKPMR